MTDQELQAELKGYLKITWSDEDDDLLKIVKRGRSYLNHKVGATIDFSINEEAKQLLLDYGRYVYNHSFELFEENFGHEILSLSIDEGIKSYEATDTETTT